MATLLRNSLLMQDLTTWSTRLSLFMQDFFTSDDDIAARGRPCELGFGDQEPVPSGQGFAASYVDPESFHFCFATYIGLERMPISMNPVAE
ncbi:hypothetical protein VP1G_11120 [Cytospora mali]|uniref:Uncharacterized protein n=1 Tax=Cytospora mali TaxID=578113 RepID=A0A194V565_CYTMA|nr:hypothetical protein VP1G_11120 [Valsa mali var. pyri (nom. inval.)]